MRVIRTVKEDKPRRRQVYIPSDSVMLLEEVQKILGANPADCLVICLATIKAAHEEGLLE